VSPSPAFRAKAAGGAGCRAGTRLLACLMAAPGTVVRRRALRRAGWPEGARVSDNTLDQYVVRLRRKLREANSSHAIDTVRGVGYRFA
jgi:DNA-binding response OmpR family regulator